jgi:hypothetical protein
MILLAAAAGISAQSRARLGKVCGDPTAPCKGRENFQPGDLPFDTGKNYVIAESQWFYGIVLKSVKITDYGNCEKPSFTEAQRLPIQKLFPRNKVFTLNCYEPGTNYYTGTADNTAFIAVYAGKTLAEANQFLKTVKAYPEYKSVRVRRMQIGINGT